MLLHITITKAGMGHDNLVFEGTAVGVPLALVLYRAALEECIKTEQDAEGVSASVDMFDTVAGWVPFKQLEHGRMLTFDDLAYGDINDGLPYIVPPLVSITFPRENNRYAELAV